jgi:hypothetical protein
MIWSAKIRPRSDFGRLKTASGAPCAQKSAASTPGGPKLFQLPAAPDEISATLEIVFGMGCTSAKTIAGKAARGDVFKLLFVMV